jgi:hypothetical protein
MVLSRCCRSLSLATKCGRHVDIKETVKVEPMELGILINPRAINLPGSHPSGREGSDIESLQVEPITQIQDPARHEHSRDWLQ